MSFAEVQVNASTTIGPKLAGDTFVQGADTVTIVYSGIAFGTVGGGAYQEVDGTHGLPTEIVSALPAGTNVLGKVEITDGTNTLGTVSNPLEVTVTNSGFAVVGTVTVVDSVPLTVNVNNSTLAVTQSGTWSLGEGSAVIGHVINDAGTAVIGGTVPSASVGSAPVGATPFHKISAANTTPAQIKGTGGTSSAGTLWEMIGMNVGTSAPAYAKFYDKAAAPTVGTDAPAYVVPLPTAGSANGAGASRSWPTGLAFANGIWLAITTGIADSDNTAPAASQVLVSGSYS